MADVHHVISLGIGAPAGVPHFLLFGLTPTGPTDFLDTAARWELRADGIVLTPVELSAAGILLTRTTLSADGIVVERTELNADGIALAES